MKQKLFLLFILACIQQQTFCQAPPCKFQTNDGNTIVTDSSQGHIVQGYIQIIKTGGNYKIHLKFMTPISLNTPAYKILKGQLLKIYLLNKDTVSLAANETKIGTIMLYPHLNMCPVVNEYDLSDADIKRILASPGVGVQVNYALADGEARKTDLVHNMFHNLFFNLMGCVMK